METFEEVQALWQSQTGAPAASAEDLMRDLRSHGRKHLTIYVIKATLVAALAFLMRAAARDSIQALAGTLLVAAGAGVILWVDWVAHRTLASVRFTASASGFVRAAIGRLRRLERPQRVHYVALLLGPVAGLNLMEVASFHELAWEWRVLGHLCLTLLVTAGAWGGFRIRSRRFARETRPLLERLEAFDAAVCEAGGPAGE